MTALLIRADAGAQIGTGHVMRCLALAQAWQGQCGPVTFACARIPAALRERLQSEGMSVHDLQADPASPEDAAHTRALAEQLGVGWLVLDGYGFDATYQRAAKPATAKLLMLDDYAHLDAYAADAILNQNSPASPAWYTHSAPQATLLLGSRYALLRREFQPYRGYQRVTDTSASRILVTLGGADPDNLTEGVMLALEQVEHPLAMRVVVGSSNPHLESLTASAARSRHQVVIAHNVVNMPELMTWADVAISAAGSTVWEAALVGLPLLTITLADNQAAIAADLAQRGAAVDLGPGHDFSPSTAAVQVANVLGDPDTRARMSHQLQRLIDGYGVERVIRHLCDAPVWLRRAQPDDAALVWNWANEPAARAASFSSDMIPWETHQQWFSTKVRAHNSAFFIALDAEDHPIGQVRFDAVNTQAAVISVSVDPHTRGHGIGSTLIAQATRRIFSEMDGLAAVDAWIKVSNTASRRAFEKAGYSIQTTMLYHGHEAVKYTCQRPENGIAKD